MLCRPRAELQINPMYLTTAVVVQGVAACWSSTKQSGFRDTACTALWISMQIIMRRQSDVIMVAKEQSN